MSAVVSTKIPIASVIPLRLCSIVPSLPGGGWVTFPGALLTPFLDARRFRMGTDRDARRSFRPALRWRPGERRDAAIRSVPCWPLDAARAMTDNCRGSGHKGASAGDRADRRAADPRWVAPRDRGAPSLSATTRAGRRCRTSRHRAGTARRRAAGSGGARRHPRGRRGIGGLRSRGGEGAPRGDAARSTASVDGDAGARQPDLPSVARGRRTGRGAPSGGEPRWRAGADRRRRGRVPFPRRSPAPSISAPWTRSSARRPTPRSW